MTLKQIVNGRERRAVAGDERSVRAQLAEWLTRFSRSQWRRTSWRRPTRGVERIHYRKGDRCLVLEVVT